MRTEKKSVPVSPVMLASCISMLALLLWPSPSKAGSFFLNPKLGLGFTLTDEGDTNTALSLGGTLGYRINQYLTVDISYTRFIPVSEDYDTPANLFGTHLTLSLPMGIITPYLRAGPGGYLIEIPDEDDATGVFFDVGAGITLSPLPFVGLHAGVNYSIIEGEDSIIEPVVGVGIGLF